MVWAGCHWIPHRDILQWGRSCGRMISVPDQVNKNAVLEDPSFEANRATDITGSREERGDALKRVAVRMGAVIQGGVGC